MFQLRFLIASPRKMSPHIFCHRDYRGQRTKPDDFHPAFNTYVCQPKGTQTSYDVMLELMQSAAANQSAQQLFTVVELFNPQTHERLKLKGDEIILRPSDLAAAQEAFNATQPASTESVNEVIPVNEDTTLGRTIGTQINFDLEAKYAAIQPDQTIHLTTLGDPTEGMLAELQSLQVDHPEAEITLIPRDPTKVGSIRTFATIKKLIHLGAILDALAANPDTQITLGDKDLGNELPSDFVNKALSLRGAVHPTLPDKTIHVDVLTHEGRAIVLGMALKPVSLGKVVSDSPSLQVSDEGVSQSPAQPSVLDRVRTEITTNGKATATQLANTLGISAQAIKDAVNIDHSGLQNKGGWISVIS